MNQLNLSQLFKNTVEIHCVVIYKNNELVITFEYMARNDAMNKVIDNCILKNLSLNNKIIFIS